MGNICSSNNNNKTGGRPPKDLSALIEESLVAEESGGVWAAQFRQFLSHRDQADLELALDFVTLASKLSAIQQESKTVGSKTRQEELRLTRVSMLQQIGKTYFQPGDAKCVALANQVLLEELSESLAKLSEKSSEAELEESFRLVMAARGDNKVWKAGLDTAYKTFLANKPSPSMKTVLLSIL